MKKQILLFDFDGTIADTFMQIVEISNRLSPEFKFKLIHPHEIDILKHNTLEETIEYLHVPKLKIPRILLRARAELHKDINSIKPIKHIEEVLHKLKQQGFYMGIITTNSVKNVREFLQAHDLDFFDFISSTSKVFGKSNSLKTLIRKKKLKIEHAYYVGDEIRDIQAAKRAGIKMIAVTWGFNAKDILQKHNPDYLISTPSELVKILH
ncbi:MAG: HAD-IA family hydrolase [Candidatus Omnitrophica bacterium]|nr:HAD-IA family hydrolase [Candidatus Omnitrophota bacterium]